MRRASRVGLLILMATQAANAGAVGRKVRGGSRKHPTSEAAIQTEIRELSQLFERQAQRTRHALGPMGALTIIRNDPWHAGSGEEAIHRQGQLLRRFRPYVRMGRLAGVAAEPEHP